MMVSALIERTLDDRRFPIRNGVFVAVVGPSGAGKDTLIAYAYEKLGVDAGADFVRRVITRPCDASSEDHDSLDEAAFAEAEAGGVFAVSWGAHGLFYGLPASVDETIEAGRVAVANVSRAVIPQLAGRYANVVVAEITASPEILAERLSARGRESREDVLARLTRTAARVDAVAANVVRIDNSATREEAGERLVSAIRRAVAFADLSDTV
jgi:ribose 1,5-bisphosphokinase